MEMKRTVHIYVKRKGKGNAQEADVSNFQEDDVDGVEQDEVRNDVGGIENVKVGNDVDGVEQVEKGNVRGVEQVKEVLVGGVEQVEDTEDSDFEAGGLSFDDIEDAITLGLDDFFDVIENQVKEKGKRVQMKLAVRKHKHTPKKVPFGVDNVGSSSGVDNEMDINYTSDELGSSDLDASDGEKEPKYPRHVVAALGFRNQCPEDFVDDYYSKDTYEKCYDYNVGPINGQDMWQEVGME
ncbi:hypothetical protein KIW84_051514 [Lathyrus oleraceus]|uniref:Uncharacterized protein n=1 Tax=Pisum sativum TaxID=3888 RepID=A0A9D5ADS0_PEA|nr:hypothetical protein KIW84_051514 [Pisum sativum]